jgi:anti-anti-sigma factor
MTLPPFPPAAGSVRVAREDGGAVMVLAGEIDADVVAVFDRSDDGSAQVIAVDASAVTFLASAGVTLLLRSTKAVRQRGQRPVLRGSSRSARRTLEVTGLLGAFDETDEPMTRRCGQ